MPKFRINCCTTKSYTLLVEAPNWEAAIRLYGHVDAGEFHACSEETGWALDGIELTETPEAPDLVVNAEGVVQHA